MEESALGHGVGGELGFAGGGEGGFGRVGAGDEVLCVRGEGEADRARRGRSIGVGFVGLNRRRWEGADGEALLAAGGEFAEDDFAVAVLGHKRVREPAAVAGKRG